MYNPNVNLFSVNTLVFRAEGTTKVVNAQDFVILRIYRYTNKFDKFVLTLEVIYILAVVIIVFMEISKWKSNREDYWVFWSYLTIGVILLSAVGKMLVYSVSRKRLCKHIASKRYNYREPKKCNKTRFCGYSK